MTEWFDHVYEDPLYRELYEDDDTRQAAADAAGAIALLDPEPESHWLELCCGFGRHAEQFAHAGHRVTGIDRSRPMLLRATQRATECGMTIGYVQADIRQLPFRETFDYATCHFDSFGYFRSDAEHLEALLSIASALRPHGRLLIELDNRERILSTWQPEISESRPPYQIRKSRTLDLMAGRLRWDMTITGPDSTCTWHLDCRLFTASELRNLLEQAGFDQIRCYGDWDGSPLTPSSRALITVARKSTFSDIAPLDD